jgi:ribonuclease Z
LHIQLIKPINQILLFILVLSCSGCSKIPDFFIERTLKQTNNGDMLKDKSKIRIFLCGTGSPQVNAKRNQSCTAILAGGKVFLFDAGENAWRSVQSCNLPISSISSVFITHWHSDHFSGLDGIINNSWIDGRKEVFTVYGPPGVDDVVKGFTMAYRFDAAYRSAHYVSNPGFAFAHPHTIIIPKNAESSPVYDDNGVHIEAYRVDHRPVEIAYGYLLTYKGKKIFISGDTRVTDIYFDAMKNADIVVHEAVNSALIRRVAECMRKLNMNTEADHTEKILEYHSDTLELAKLAERAGVKHLVLTHLVPEPSNFMLKRMFLHGMSDYYHGTLTLGYDAMMIELK